MLRIKQLLLVEGLTLAGARRRLEEESGPIGADAPVIDELIGRHARERLTAVKRGLRSILDLLANRAGAAEFQLSAGPLPAVSGRGSAARWRVARRKGGLPPAGRPPRLAESVQRRIGL